MDEGKVAHGLFPPVAGPCFGMPIIQGSPQTNASYIQQLDLRGRIDGFEQFAPPWHLCAAAPGSLVRVRVGEPPAHVVRTPDGAMLVGPRAIISPLIAPWVGEVTHPTLQMSFAEFVGAQDQLEIAAHAAVERLARQAGLEVAQKWFLDAVVLRRVQSKLLALGHGQGDPSVHERWVGECRIAIDGRVARLEIPTPLREAVETASRSLVDEFEDAVRLSQVIGLERIAIEPASVSKRGQLMGSGEGQTTTRRWCGILVIGNEQVFRDVCRARAAADLKRIFDPGPQTVFIREDRVCVGFARDAHAGHDVLNKLIHIVAGEPCDLLIVAPADEALLKEFVLTDLTSIRFENVAVYGCIVPAAIDPRFRALEVMLATSERFAGVLSCANAWTPISNSSRATIQPGSASRIAACIDGWVCAASTGLLNANRTSGRRGEPSWTRVITTIQFFTYDEDHVNAEALHLLANPAWPDAGQNTYVIAPTRSRERAGFKYPGLSLAERLDKDRRIENLFTSKRHVRRDRDADTFAIAFTPLRPDGPERGFEKYVAETLEGLGWIIHGSPDPSVDLVATFEGALRVSIIVKSSYAAAEIKLREQAVADGTFVVVPESDAPSSPRAAIVGFDRLHELAEIAGLADSFSRRPELRLQTHAPKGVVLTGLRASGFASIPPSVAKEILADPSHPLGENIVPVISSRDVTRFPEGRWALDVPELPDASPAEVFGAVRDGRFDTWFERRSGRPADRFVRARALGVGAPFIVTPTVAGQRLFVRCHGEILPTNSLLAIHETQPWLLALLSSRIHRIWAETVSPRLGGFRRYSKRVAETFPLPTGYGWSEKTDDPMAEHLVDLSSRLEALQNEMRFGAAWKAADFSQTFLQRLTLQFSDDDWREHAPSHSLTRSLEDPPDRLKAALDEIDELLADLYAVPVNSSDERIRARLMELNQERTAS